MADATGAMSDADRDSGIGHSGIWSPRRGRASCPLLRIVRHASEAMHLIRHRPAKRRYTPHLAAFNPIGEADGEQAQNQVLLAGPVHARRAIK